LANKKIYELNIITVGIKLIAKDGFEKLKYLDLSKEAEISHTTLKKYFRTKGEVLVAVLNFIWTKLMKTLDEELRVLCCDEMDKVKKIFSIITDYLLLEKNKDEAFILLFESREKGYLTNIIDDNPVEDLFDLLNKLFRAGQEKNILRKDLLANDMATIVWSIVEECLFRNYLNKNKTDFPGLTTKRIGDYETKKRVLKIFNTVLESFRT